jgi:hypothetical protein
MIKNIEAAVKFPTPISQKDIKSFLGLAAYCRKFIANFSAIARRLTNLLKKENEWNWTEQEHSSFDLLKFKLTNTPLLQYPDFSKPFTLITDARGYAIEAILSQGKLGQDKPIAYACRMLNKAELNYACKHFKTIFVRTQIPKSYRPQGFDVHFQCKAPKFKVKEVEITTRGISL